MYLFLSLLMRAVSIYIGLLFIYALLSWLPRAQDSFLGRLLAKICEPYLSLFSHLPLSFGGFDFTILVAAIVLELASNGLYLIISRIMFF